MNFGTWLDCWKREGCLLLSLSESGMFERLKAELELQKVLEWGKASGLALGLELVVALVVALVVVLVLVLVELEPRQINIFCHHVSKITKTQ